MTKGEAIRQVKWLLDSGELAGLDDKSRKAIKVLLKEAATNAP